MPVFYVMGTFFLFFSFLSLYTYIDDLPYENRGALMSFVILFALVLITFTLRKRAELSNEALEHGWEVLFIKLLQKRVPLKTFDAILLSKKTITGGQTDALSSTRFYSLILADTSVYNFDTWVVTPRIAKGIYELSDHYNFNLREENALQNCLKVGQEVSCLTGLKLIYENDELKEEANKIARAI